MAAGRTRKRSEASKIHGSLAWKVFEGRLIRGLTQTQLADRTRKLRPPGLRQPAIAAIENGDTTWVRGNSLLALAEALECSPQYLAGDEPDPTPRVKVGLEDGPFADMLSSLTPENRQRWQAYGQGLLDSQPHTPSAHTPYPHPRAPAKRR